jgi:hypothetical protein
MEDILVGALGTAIIFAIFYIVRLMQRIDSNVHSKFTIMQKELEGVKEELENLKERKRQTGPTMAGLEDISAALMRIRVERQYENDLLEASLNTLGKLRQGPYSYDPETPSVRKGATSETK